MTQQNPPEKIDKYQILSVLGKGAMGVVYHAYDPVVKRDVALKLLSSLDLEETEMVSRFEREARLAGGLRHPNIVTIYDLGHFDNRPYIVMEYIVGRDLETLIKERAPLTFEQKTDIILQTCKGLYAAHQKGIIHRDIKPANIRVQDDDTVKIMDFGIARMGASQLTRSGYIIGTLQYMSPEQISGEQLDQRTDLFSTGVIAYELFTYTNPFTGGGAVDIMYRILNIRPQPITDLPEEFATDLNQVVMRALEKNKDLRYPGAREMAQDLEEFLFYVKTVKLRPKLTGRSIPITEGTQQLPPERIVAAPHAPSSDVLPTVGIDIAKQRIPTFGAKEEVAQPAPRTGVGANFSQTAQQVLMKPSGGVWQEKKFFILGAIVALLFIGGLILTSSLQKDGKPDATALTVSSTPPGADVWVEDQLIAKTPATFSEKKNMTMLFKLKGYKDKSVTLSQEAWPLEVNVTLVQAPVETTTGPRSIHVESTPPGADLLLDGTPAGKSPADVSVPDDKEHELVAKLEGYEEDKRKVDKSTTGTLSIELKQSAVPGTVRYIGSFPATAFLEGKALKMPASLPPGSYSLSFRGGKNAFIRFSRKVEVVAGETVTVSGPSVGQITIKANPSNCRISVDGEFIDEAPIFNLPIQTGSYMIQFNWPTLGKKLNKPVTITPDQSQTIVGVPE